MNFRKTLTYTTAIVLLGAGSAMAESTIEALPAEGRVSLSGKVDSVRDADTFILRDSANETIDVHTTQAHKLEKGAAVKISGTKEAEVAGIGRQISNARVESSANLDAKAMKEDRTAAMVDGNADVNVKGDTVANAKVNPDASLTVGNTTAAVDVARDTNAQAEVAAVKPDNAQSRRDMPTNTNTAAFKVDGDIERHANADVKADVKADRDMKASATVDADATVASTIEALPTNGAVNLSGVVASVDGDNKFTLRDNAGETIDVNTQEKLEVSEGEQVRVSGNVKPEFANFGREIQADNVVRLSSK